MDICSVWSVFLFYALMASTFTLAKVAVIFMTPLLFIGIRMILGGAFLLAYLYWWCRKKWYFKWSDWPLLVQIVFFHIYVAYVFEFWGLQHMTSAKACLFYNLAPFITALLSYFLLTERLSSVKIIALLVGFIGMIPLFITDMHATNSLIFSIADAALLIAVTATAYGWIVMHKLVNTRAYSPLMVNGIGMIGGGVLALLTAALVEHPFSFVRIPLIPINTIHATLIQLLGPAGAAVSMMLLALLLLLVFANIIGYNWYGYLLKTHSATFLSLAGLTAPLFAAVYGWIFLGESIGSAFLLSAAITSCGVYLFYKSR